ncbi:MAG: TonB-dependent receptor, partial [Proteobacteria bacterium]|nr:TonB-dependent receptor [Pseudomonadota bacterium]
LKEESSLSCTLNYSRKQSGSPGRIDYPTPEARSEKEDWGTTIGYKARNWEVNTYASGFDKRNKNLVISLDYTMKSQVLGGDIKTNVDVPYLGSLVLGTGGKRSEVDANKVGKHEEDELSLFGEKEVRFEGLPLSLGLGLRGRRHSEYEWALNPQVSLTYELAKGHVRLSANRATTIPTFYERYCKSTFREGNPDLSEEKAINYNAGLRYKFNQFLDVGMALFFADINDFITSVEGKDRVWRYVNVESASRKGMELESKMSLFDGLTINGVYTYLEAKNDDTGKYIIYRPKHKVNIRLKYTFCDKLIFHLNDQYVSKRFSDHENTETLPGYNLLDLEIDYPVGKATLFGKIDNLLGEEYEVHKKYPMPKTTYTVGVTYEF